MIQSCSSGMGRVRVGEHGRFLSGSANPPHSPPPVPNTPHNTQKKRNHPGTRQCKAQEHHKTPPKRPKTARNTRNTQETPRKHHQNTPCKPANPQNSAKPQTLENTINIHSKCPTSQQTHPKHPQNTPPKNPPVFRWSRVFGALLLVLPLCRTRALQPVGLRSHAVHSQEQECKKEAKGLFDVWGKNSTTCSGIHKSFVLKTSTEFRESGSSRHDRRSNERRKETKNNSKR